MLVNRHGDLYRDVVKRMGRDGWLGVGWPTEYGGRGFGEIEQRSSSTRPPGATSRCRT